MRKFKIKNEKLFFVILLISLFIVFLLYYKFIILDLSSKNSFAEDMFEIADENESSIFNIQKIVTYNSANAIDNSEDHSLKNMSLSQYSDISIYIDNRCRSYFTIFLPCMRPSAERMMKMPWAGCFTC